MSADLLRVYLDTSVVVAAITREPHTERARAVLGLAAVELVISDWTINEVSAALSLMERIGALAEVERRIALRTFQQLAQESLVVEHMVPADFVMAAALADRSSPAVRAGDALHIALVQRTGAALATFDAAMARVAAEHGLEVRDAN